MTYFKSEQVKVFPCSYRGIANEDGTLDTSKIIDPESRLSTEKNLTQLGRIQNAASATRSANSGIEEEINPFSYGAILKCVIDGYHFEITLRPGDFSAGARSMAVGIKTKEVNLIDDVKTTTLENLKNPAASFLDSADGDFCGLVLDSTAVLNAGGYKFVEIIDSNGNFNEDNLMGSVALDVTPSQELYADKDGKIKSFDITYGIGSDKQFTTAEQYDKSDRSIQINYVRGFSRKPDIEGMSHAVGTGKMFKITSGKTNIPTTGTKRNQGTFYVNNNDLSGHPYENLIAVNGLGTNDSPEFTGIKVGTLNVTGASTLTGKVTANGGLDVTGKVTASSAEITGNLKAVSIDVTNKLTAGSIEVGNTSVNGNLSVSGTISGGTVKATSVSGNYLTLSESHTATQKTTRVDNISEGLYLIKVIDKKPYGQASQNVEKEYNVLVSIDNLGNAVFSGISNIERTVSIEGEHQNGQFTELFRVLKQDAYRKGTTSTGGKLKVVEINTTISESIHDIHVISIYRLFKY